MRKYSLIPVLALVALAACRPPREAKRDAEYAAGVQSHRIEGVIRVEVSEIRVRKHKIHVKMSLLNLGETELHFARNNIHLDYGETKVRPVEHFIGERDVDLLPGRSKRKTYIFEAEPKGADVLSGDYDLVFTGFYTLDPGGRKTLIDQTLSFKLKVP